MPVPSRKSAARLFASSCLTVAGLLIGAGGCERDDERADRAVEDSLHAAARERGEAAVAGFQKGAQEPGASPAATAHAKSLLAQAEVEHARAVLRDVDANEVVIARLVSEISNITGQVHANNATIAGYLELAPKTTDSIAKLLLAERGKVEGNGAEAVWDLGERGQLPALSRTTAQAQKFESEIGGLEGKLKGLTAQRAQADRKASELLTQSRRTTGRKSVDLFAQSAAQTKVAADLANQMGQLEHQLLRMRQDLALAQAQTQQLQTALTGFSSQIEENQKSQAEIEALIEKQRAQSNQLVHGDGGPPVGQAAGATDAGAEPGEATPAAAVEAEAGTPQTAPAEGAGDTGDTAEPGDGAPAEAEGDAQPAAFQEDGGAPPEGQPPVESDATPPAESAAPPAETPEAGTPDAGSADAGGGGPAAPAAEGAAPAVAAPTGPVTIVTNVTIAAKANELATLATQTATRRAQAIALLNSALARYDAAIADANALLTKVNADLRNPDLRSMPQQASWKSMAEVYSVLKLNLQKADVQHMVAAVHRDAAAGLAGRRQMAAVVNEVLTEAGIQVPAGLSDPKVDAEFEAHRKGAQEAYDATDTLLNGVLEGSGGAPSEEEAKRNAQIAKVVAQYGRAQLAQVGNDATAAERLLSEARQTVNSGAPIATEQYPLYLRIALGLVTAPELATTLPTPEPAPEPTTQATEPEAAPPPPAEPAPAPEPEPAPAPPAAPSTGPPQGGGMPGSPGSVPPGGPPAGGGMPPGMPGMPGGAPPGGPPPGGGMPPGMPGMPGGVPPGGPPSGGGMPPGMPGMPGGAPPGGPPGGGMPPGMPGMPGGGMPPGGPGAGPPQGMPGQPGQQAPGSGASKGGKGKKSGKSKKGTN